MMERNTRFATHDVPLHNNIAPLAAYTAAILPSSCAGSLACVVPPPHVSRASRWHPLLTRRIPVTTESKCIRYCDGRFRRVRRARCFASSGRTTNSTDSGFVTRRSARTDNQNAKRLRRQRMPPKTHGTRLRELLLANNVGAFNPRRYIYSLLRHWNMHKPYVFTLYTFLIF